MNLIERIKERKAVIVFEIPSFDKTGFDSFTAFILEKKLKFHYNENKMEYIIDISSVSSIKKLDEILDFLEKRCPEGDNFYYKIQFTKIIDDNF